MKRNTEEIRKLLGAADTSGNRFRKDKPKTSEETGDSSKGLSAIDSWKKPSEKATDLFSKASARNTRGGKKAAEKDKAKEQTANKDKKVYNVHLTKFNVCQIFYSLTMYVYNVIEFELIKISIFPV